MEYFIEELYKLVGRDDKVAVIDFIEESDNYKEYGKSITVLFEYTQFEREKLEKAYRKEELAKSHGKARVKFLTGPELSDEQKENLIKDGINTANIETVLPGWVHENLFYEEKTRSIRKIEVPVERKPRGGDYNWMYGFKKKRVSEGLELHPEEREWYLAMKKFFEEDELTAEELIEMNSDGKFRPEIEMKFLEMKLECEIISEEEDKRYDELLKNSIGSNFEILKKEINDAGLSIDTLNKKHPELFMTLIKGITDFVSHRINVLGKKAIFLDWKGFLHIFLRHCKEFEIGEQSKEKTKFLWTPRDITMVIDKVIDSVDSEIQDYWEKNPNQRFSKYGEQSLYFQGDFYTFHIEGDGRLSTFHQTKKKIE